MLQCDSHQNPSSRKTSSLGPAQHCAQGMLVRLIQRCSSTPRPQERVHSKTTINSVWLYESLRAFTAQVQLQPCLCVPTRLPSFPPGASLASAKRCGEGVLSAPKADGSLASATLLQANPAFSARIPFPLPRPTGWDRPQPAGLPALINTGQAAKAAAGSILSGGPSSAGSHGGGA